MRNNTSRPDNPLHLGLQQLITVKLATPLQEKQKIELNLPVDEPRAEMGGEDNHNGADVAEEIHASTAHLRKYYDSIMK